MATGNNQGYDQNDAEKQFTDVLKDAGFELEQNAVMDGKWHRVPVDGDKGKQTSGSYRGFLDGIRPAGVYRNFKKDGSAISWKYEGEAAQLTTEDRARIEASRRDREAAQQRQYEERADYTAGVVAKLSPASLEHPYLVRKQVSAHGLLQDRHGNLVMPLQDVDGKVWSTQIIKPDGEKMFTKSGRTHGLYFQVGADDPTKPNIIVEGYATAATIHELSGLPVKVALNKGNLREVAFSLSINEPNRPIIVSGDNDHEKVGQINPKTNQPYVNGGKIASEETAAFIGNQVRVALVQFEKGQAGTDWNDLAVNYGKDVALEQMREAFGPTLERGAQDSAPQNARNQQPPFTVTESGTTTECASLEELESTLQRFRGHAVMVGLFDGRNDRLEVQEDGAILDGYGSRHAISFDGSLRGTRFDDAYVRYQAQAQTENRAVAEESPRYKAATPSAEATIVPLNPARLSAGLLSTELEAMDAKIRGLADTGQVLSAEDRRAAVATAEAAIAKVDGYAIGSDRLAKALNAMPEPQHRAALGLARTLATTDAAGGYTNPFENEALKVAYQRERAFQDRLVKGRSSEQPGKTASADQADKPRPALTAEAQAEVAQTYLNANDVISRRKASEAHPALKNAFALEAALSKFAEESLPPVLAVRFMTAQKDLIAGKLRSGGEIPTVLVRESRQVSHEQPEH